MGANRVWFKGEGIIVASNRRAEAKKAESKRGISIWCQKIDRQRGNHSSKIFLTGGNEENSMRRQTYKTGKGGDLTERWVRRREGGLCRGVGNPEVKSSH